MRVEELIRPKEEVFRRCCELTRAKGSDYSGEEDTLANLKNVEVIGLMRSEIGVFVRLMDKMMRLKQFIKNHGYAVAEESLVDTIVDAHNYLDLFLALLVERGVVKMEEKKEEEKLKEKAVYVKMSSCDGDAHVEVLRRDYS